MKKLLKTIDWKLCIIYVAMAVAIALIITSCHASRKNVSVNKSKVDSSAQTVAKVTHVATTDSAVTKVSASSYDKVTDITYEVFYPSPGADPVFVPRISIKEKGSKSKQQETHVQKKDTLTGELKKEVSVQKEQKIIEKHKVKKGFDWWLLLFLVPLVLLVPQIRKRISLKL